MSSPRVSRMLSACTDQLKRLLSGSFDIYQVVRWQGLVAAGPLAGNDAILIDLTSATWATGNSRAILVAIPASDLQNQAGFKTQSHSAGQFIDGSVRLNLYVETPASWTGTQAMFERTIQHHFVGQLGAPVELFFSGNTVEPTLQGVNGAGSSATYTSAGVYLPYGSVLAPGGI